MSGSKAAVVAMLGATAVLAGCGGDDGPPASAQSQNSYNKAPAAATPAADRPAVTATGNAFKPSAITVDKGDSVRFTNADGVAHTVTAGGSNGTFDINLEAGDSAKWTFKASGRFAYYCSLHPVMRGVVTVR